METSLVEIFWKNLAQKTKKGIPLSKYEKRFFIFDLLITSGLYGQAFGIVLLLQNGFAFVLAVVYMFIHAWVRNLVWIGMEKRERQELLGRPEKETASLFDIYNKDGIVGDKAVGQWDK